MRFYERPAILRTDGLTKDTYPLLSALFVTVVIFANTMQAENYNTLVSKAPAWELDYGSSSFLFREAGASPSWFPSGDWEPATSTNTKKLISPNNHNTTSSPALFFNHHLATNSLNQNWNVRDNATFLPKACRVSRLAMAMSRVSGSRLPKPSSINRDSTWVLLEDSDANPKASARDTRKLSPRTGCVRYARHRPYPDL